MDLDPYKTILKILLLESYLYENPNIKLLAIDFKKYLHDGSITSLELDSYYMMLKKITIYLIKIGDLKRLDLIRKCFYIKTRVKLSINKKICNWQYYEINILVKNWKWNFNKIKYLDNIKY
nr:class I adenylate cyclase [Enterobacteriaceae endosymbiont of Plateumaris braccata]